MEERDIKQQKKYWACFTTKSKLLSKHNTLGLLCLSEPPAYVGRWLPLWGWPVLRQLPCHPSHSASHRSARPSWLSRPPRPFVHGEIQLAFAFGKFYDVTVFECLLSTQILILAKKYLKSYSLSHLCFGWFFFLAGACVETYGFDGRSHSPENLC